MSGREGLQSLLDHGVIDAVIRPLQSGKEAQVWLVEAHGEVRVAKIYKEAATRSFKHRSAYTEGRQVRRSRDMRAMKKGSRYGKEQVEAAWRDAEVDAIYKLRAADVRVPRPFDYIDGVLVMELVQGPDGDPAPRLADVNLEPDEAVALHDQLIREVVKMLCAGLVHGDLSDFNVLLAWDGPVVIDFPQAVDAAANQNARKLLLRDVKNLSHFFSRWAPKLRKTRFGPEMWDLYERGTLTPDTKLTGKHKKSSDQADVDAIIAEIQAAEAEERARRERLGLPERRRARTPKATKGPPPRPIGESKGAKNGPGESEEGQGKRKRRKRKKRGGRSGSSGTSGSGRDPGRSGDRSRRSGGGRAREESPPPVRSPDDEVSFDDLDALLSED